MSPIDPRDAGDAVGLTVGSSNSVSDDSGWTFRAWAIAIPLGIVAALVLAFIGYYLCHRKELSRRRARVDPDELPAYRPPLGEGKGPPAYAPGQEAVALGPLEAGLTNDGRTELDGPAEPPAQLEGPGHDPMAAPAGQPSADSGLGSVAAPEPARLA